MAEIVMSVHEAAVGTAQYMGLKGSWVGIDT